MAVKAFDSVNLARVNESGRNLILNSSEEQYIGLGGGATYKLSTLLTLGKKYTVGIMFKPSLLMADDSIPDMYFRLESNINGKDLFTIDLSKYKNEILQGIIINVSKTFICDFESLDNDQFKDVKINFGLEGRSKILKIKIEEGDEATPWSPAPEDIEDAKKTATNFMSFDNGLVIGNLTGSTLGKNVFIDNDEIDIRDNTKILASFKENLIELGKSSPDATISLCGEKGRIYFGADEVLGGYRNNLTFTSDNIVLQGKEYSGLYHAYKWNEAGQDKAQESEVSVGRDGVLLAFSICNALEADGSGNWTGCNLDVSDWGIYGLGNNVVFEGRYSAGINSIAGDVNISAPVGTLNLSAEKITINNDIDLIGKAQVGTLQNPAGGVNIVNNSGAYTANNAAGNGRINLIFATSGNHVQIGGGSNPIPGNIYIKTGRAVQILTEDPVSTTDTGIIFSVRNSGTSGGSTTSKDGIFFATGCDADGGFIRSYYTYARTTTKSANLYITSSGTFARHASSSRKYKTDIISIDDNLKKHTSQNFMDDRLNIEPIIDPHGLYDIPVMQYKYIDGYLASEDVNVGKDVIGIIAEDVAQFYPQAAIYDEKGVPEAWNSEPVLVGLLYLVQEQKKEIEAIKQQLKGIIK